MKSTAHRLGTIADADMILTMSKGEVAEFEPPQNLLSNKVRSKFYPFRRRSIPSPANFLKIEHQGIDILLACSRSWTDETVVAWIRTSWCLIFPGILFYPIESLELISTLHIIQPYTKIDEKSA
jgi:hypothetical protein